MKGIGNFLIVTPTAGYFGGTERVLETLISQANVESGISIAFLEDGPLATLAKERGLACTVIERQHFRNPVDTWRVIRSIRKFIVQNEAQAVLAWTDFAQLYASQASIGLCKSTWWQRSNVERSWNSFLCRMLPYSRAIANSNFIRNQLVLSGVRVIKEPLYPPFQNDRFNVRIDKNEIRRTLGLPQDRRIIGSVGRMQQWKGFETFVSALQKLREQFSDVFGLIVGSKHNLESGYEAKLRQHISSLGLTEHLQIVDSQRNVADWMSAMDIFVHAAIREPFGIVVPEAMSLGLPIVASIPGGPAEAIENGISGLLVQSSDVPELELALRRFLSSPEFAFECGESARSYSRKFSSEGFVERLRDAVNTAVC